MKQNDTHLVTVSTIGVVFRFRFLHMIVDHLIETVAQLANVLALNAWRVVIIYTRRLA